jgi:hypothetical protein
MLHKRPRAPELAAALGLVVLPGHAGGLPIPGVSLSSVATHGARTVVVSASSSAALWVIRRLPSGGLVSGGCVRPLFQPRCAPTGSGENFGEAPIATAGRDVYVADAKHEVIVHWRWARGHLGFAGCLAAGGAHGCQPAGTATPGTAEHMALVRGGRILAASTQLGHVALYRRSPQTGRLDPAGCVGAGDGCRSGVLPQQSGLWIAGAGNWLFAAGGDSLTSFAPGARGAPTARRGECLTDAGTFFAEVDALPGCRTDAHAAGDSDFGMTLFANDRFVYSSDFTSGGNGTGLVWWRRGAGGKLTFAGCLGEGAATGKGCAKGTAAAEDPSLFAQHGSTLAVGGTTAQGIALLRVNRRTGAVRPVRGKDGCVTETGDAGNPFNPSLGEPPPPGCQADPHLVAVSGIALRPAGDILYAAGAHRLLAYGVR